MIHGLKALHLTEEEAMVILIILGTPENHSRMVDWLCELDKEPSMEDLVRIAKTIKKY